MWWEQFCTWVALQGENENALDQIQWNSLVSNIPGEARYPDVYQAFLISWRALTVEDNEGKDSFSLAYKQKLLSIIDKAQAYLNSQEPS